jgi:hypothetical protein
MDNQLLLFPEKIIYNDIESFDLSNIPVDFYRQHFKKLSDLPKDTYYIFKTGGINLYMQEKGPIFPFVQNKKTGIIYSVYSSTTDVYPRVGVGKLTLRIHRIAAQAFIPNPNNFMDVDHIDGNHLNWCLDNLRWVSKSQNMKKVNIKDQKYLNRHEKLKKSGSGYY